MRFGQTLRESVYPPWKDKYLDYNKVKKLLREDETSPDGRGTRNESWTENDEENFVNELTNIQLEKVHKHQVETFESLNDRIKAIETRFEEVTKNDAEDEEKRKKTAEDAGEELDVISKELNELRKFSRINYSGFLKAAKKHDRRRGNKYRVRPMLQVRLAHSDFYSEDYQPLINRLFGCYEWCRRQTQTEEQKGDDKKESDTSVRPQDEYKSMKFWVHMDNVLEVKAVIMRRLPALVYNPLSVKVIDTSQADPTLTSIYFDDAQFQLYQDKVTNAPEASSLRLRWTGQLEDKPEILLEKKLVDETTGSRDIRIQMKEKRIMPFLRGEYKMEKEIKKLEDLLGEDSSEVNALKTNVEAIQTFVQEKKLEPVLRASYTRSAFQIPGDDKIRISIDTNLALIREDDLDTDRPCRDPDNWHRTDIDGQRMHYPYDGIKQGEISRFPHAILEIKYKDDKYTKKDSWLSDLMNSHLVHPSPKFSKFAHGVAQLFEDYVNSFPFWLSDLATDIRKSPEDAFQAEQDRHARNEEDSLAVGSYLPGSKLSESFKAQFGSPRGTGKRPEVSKFAGFSTSAQAGLSQLGSTAEEHDSDDDGDQAPRKGIDIHSSSKKTGITSFLPTFSTTRYGQRHRRGGAYDDAPLPRGVQKPGYWIKDQGPPKVEAKVWLANQRTFIKWQHVAVLLATLSLGLYNAARVNDKIAITLACIYTAFAVFTSLWGWWVYLWRSRLIIERSGKNFDNMIGPFVVTIGLAAALVLNFAFKYDAATTEREKKRREVVEAMVNGTAGLLAQGL